MRVFVNMPMTKEMLSLLELDPLPELFRMILERSLLATRCCFNKEEKHCQNFWLMAENKQFCHVLFNVNASQDLLT